MNKEQIYDEKISPLMKQIIDICMENNIPVFAEFQFGPTDFVKTRVTKDAHAHWLFDWLDACTQCAEKDGMNADKFIMWLLRSDRENKSSACLHLLGKKVDL